MIFGHKKPASNYFVEKSKSAGFHLTPCPTDLQSPPLHEMERGSPCPSVLPRTECARHEVRPQGRRKGISLDPEIFGIEGHPEGDKWGRFVTKD